MLLSQIVGIYSRDLATSFYNLWAFFDNEGFNEIFHFFKGFQISLAIFEMSK